MTRNVFDNRMVAHVWAQQSQDEGRSNNGQFYFDGATIYSYGRHFPIATFHNAKDGRRFVLFTQRGYSPTTSKHIHYTRSAIPRDVPVYFVPKDPRHLETLRADFQEQIDAAVQAAAREKVEGRRNHAKRSLDYLARAAQIAERGNELAGNIGQRWKLKAPAVDPAEVEKAAKAQARKEAATAKARAEREAKQAKERAEAQAAWLAGADVWAGHFDAATGGPALRVFGDELQTSHGARVPLAHAVKVFRFLKLCREQGAGDNDTPGAAAVVVWRRNGHSVRVGLFTVDEVYADGSFQAGCHHIQWTEVERVARLIGVFDEPASNAALSATHEAA